MRLQGKLAALEEAHGNLQSSHKEVQTALELSRAEASRLGKEAGQLAAVVEKLEGRCEGQAKERGGGGDVSTQPFGLLTPGMTCIGLHVAALHGVSVALESTAFKRKSSWSCLLSRVISRGRHVMQLELHRLRGFGLLLSRSKVYPLVLAMLHKGRNQVAL